MLKQINHARRNATFNIALLRKQGYRQIGRGAFARVFVHPDAPDVVVKVGSRKSRHDWLSHLECRFPEFAERARRSHSKFYPKIYDIRLAGDDYLVIMKRYDKIKGERKTRMAICNTAQTLSGNRFLTYKPDVRRYGRALKPLVEAGYVMDLHGKNIMQDRDGTPILVDPICQRINA